MATAAANRIEELQRLMAGVDPHMTITALTEEANTIPDAIQNMLDAQERVFDQAMFLLSTKFDNPMIQQNAEGLLVAITAVTARFLCDPRLFMVNVNVQG